MKPEEFVLDKVENPHPRMLAGALAARRRTRQPDIYGPKAATYWAGYLEAMADATGCDRAELEAWLDHHEEQP